jgi:hypothetical protein
MTSIPVDPNQQLTLAAVIDFLRTAPLSADDRVAVLRALRDGIRDLVPPDPALNPRLRAARGVPPDFVESTINGIANSLVWQHAAAATPDELRTHLAFEEHRPFAQELQTLLAILEYSLRHHHWSAVEKARIAYHSGKTLGGAEGHTVKPHLKIMSSHLPKSQRKTRKKPAPEATAVVPAPSK